MKPTTVENLKVGLVVAVAGIGGGAWHYSGVVKQLEFNTRSVVEINSKLDQLLGMKTDIEVIRTKVQQMERPVIRTSRDVRSLRSEVAALTPGLFSPYYKIPLTMTVGGR